MITIRTNTFETNSSSTHSLVIATSKDDMDNLKCHLSYWYDDKEIEEKINELDIHLRERYSRNEIYRSLISIGASLTTKPFEFDGLYLNLSCVNEAEFDFGGRFHLYNDPAHKILFVLTMLEDPCGLNDNDFDEDDYYYKRFMDFLNSELYIKKVIPPQNGWTGIDHQSREDIIEQVKYNMEEFVLRKDYILLLDHD